MHEKGRYIVTWNIYAIIADYILLTYVISVHTRNTIPNRLEVQQALSTKYNQILVFDQRFARAQNFRTVFSLKMHLNLYIQYMPC